MRHQTILLFSGILSFGSIAFGQHQMPPPLVKVETAKSLTETAPKEYIGHVEASEEVDLYSRISGEITDIKFTEGSIVQKDALLITIEDTTYRAKVMAAKAKVAQIEAELEYADSNYNRQSILSEKKAVATSTLEDAKRLVSYTKAHKEEAAAELMDAENNLGYTTIEAPITGRIGEIAFTKGNYVNVESGALAKIVSIDPIDVKFSVSERDFLNLFHSPNSPNPNIKVKLRLPNGEVHNKTGKVTFIDNIVDPETDTIKIGCEFENKDNKLIPGGYVTVLLTEKTDKPMVGVPLSAVMTDNVGNYVYVVGADNKPTRREVTTEGAVNNLSVITNGLKAGERIITDGTHKVIPGMPITPFENQTPPSKVKK